MDEATATACAETKRRNVIHTNLPCYKNDSRSCQIRMLCRQCNMLYCSNRLLYRIIKSKVKPIIPLEVGWFFLVCFSTSFKNQNSHLKKVLLKLLKETTYMQVCIMNGKTFQETVKTPKAFRLKQWLPFTDLEPLRFLASNFEKSTEYCSRPTVASIRISNVDWTNEQYIER